MTMSSAGTALQESPWTVPSVLSPITSLSFVGWRRVAFRPTLLPPFPFFTHPPPAIIAFRPRCSPLTSTYTDSGSPNAAIYRRQSQSQRTRGKADVTCASPTAHRTASTHSKIICSANASIFDGLRPDLRFPSLVGLEGGSCFSMKTAKGC